MHKLIIGVSLIVIIFFAFVFADVKLGGITGSTAVNTFTNNVYDNTYFPLFRLISPKALLPIEAVK